MHDLLTDILLPGTLILVMMGLGMTLKVEDFTRVLRIPRAFLVGAVCQMLLLPLLALVTIAVFQLSGPLAVGLLVIALCPGGVISNLVTYLAKGDAGLSVSLTAVIGLITPLTMPLLLKWAMLWQGLDGSGFELPYGRTVMTLLVTCVLPVPLGMLLVRWVKVDRKRLEVLVSRSSTLLVVGVIFLFCQEVGWVELLGYALVAGGACVSLNLLATLTGYGLASAACLQGGQRVCIALEVGIQNAAIAYMVTMGIMKNVEMSIVPAVYGLWMSVPALLVAWISQKRQSGVVTPARLASGVS